MKIKKITAFVVACVALMFGVWACSEYKGREALKPSLMNQSNLPVVYSLPINNDSLIIQIVIRHNQILEEAIGNIDWSSTLLNQELNSYFLNYTDSSIDFLINNRSDIQESVISNLEIYLNQNLNDSVYQMMINCKYFIAQKPNYSDLVSQFDLYREYSRNTFNGGDLEMALVFLEVTEKSAYFWMPESAGGSGIGWNFINDYAENNNIPLADISDIDWGAIAWADGAGAVGTLLRTWYLAGWGPLSWGAIVGAIGWGAAWSSGTAVLGQLLL